MTPRKSGENIICLEAMRYKNLTAASTEETKITSTSHIYWCPTCLLPDKKMMETVFFLRSSCLIKHIIDFPYGQFSESLGSRKGHQQIWEDPIVCHTFAHNDAWQIWVILLKGI